MSEALQFVLIALLATAVIILRSGRRTGGSSIGRPFGVRLWSTQTQYAPQYGADAEAPDAPEPVGSGLVPITVRTVAHTDPAGSIEIMYRPQTGIRDRASSRRARSR